MAIGKNAKVTTHRGWQIETKRMGIHGEYGADILSPDGRRRYQTHRFSGPGARDRAQADAIRIIDGMEDALDLLPVDGDGETFPPAKREPLAYRVHVPCTRMPR